MDAVRETLIMYYSKYPAVRNSQGPDSLLQSSKEIIYESSHIEILVKLILGIIHNENEEWALHVVDQVENECKIYLQGLVAEMDELMQKQDSPPKHEFPLSLKEERSWNSDHRKQRSSCVDEFKRT